MRAISAEDLDGHDCVMHLAAISNDPMGDLDPGLTYSVNRDASIGLASVAKQAGVGRFLFSGSCSVYGNGREARPRTSDPLNPLTAYAEVEDRDRGSRLASWPMTASRPPFCATPPPTDSRPCCASISSSTTSSPAPSPTGRSGS